MSQPRALLRLLLAFLTGFCLPSLAERAVGLAFPQPFEPGPARFWVADRDGGRVVGLDASLFETAEVSCAAPVCVAARADGGAWVLDALLARGPHRLLRIDAGGVPRAALQLDGGGALTALDAEDALVLAAAGEGGPARALRVGAGGAVVFERALPGARAAAGRGARLAVGFDDGRVALYDLAHGGALTAERAAAAPVLDVAPGPPGMWWVLAGAEPRLYLFDEALAPRWDHAPLIDALSLAPVPGEERVWLVSGAGPRALRCGAFGRAELDLPALPHAGLGRGAAQASGGVALAFPGAVLLFDARGALELTQGGFDFAVGVDRVP